jgi:hypothetical protein
MYYKQIETWGFWFRKICFQLYYTTRFSEITIFQVFDVFYIKTSFLRTWWCNKVKIIFSWLRNPMFLSVCNTFIGLKSNCLKVCCTSIPILLYKFYSNGFFPGGLEFRPTSWASADKHFLNHLGGLSNIKGSNLLGEMGWNLPSLALGLLVLISDVLVVSCAYVPHLTVLRVGHSNGETLANVAVFLVILCSPMSNTRRFLSESKFLSRYRRTQGPHCCLIGRQTIRTIAYPHVLNRQRRAARQLLFVEDNARALAWLVTSNLASKNKTLSLSTQ